MRKQISNCNLACHPWVEQLEAGQMLYDRVIPCQLSLIHQHGERGGSETFGVRSEVEDSFCIDTRGLIYAPHAITLYCNFLAVLNERECDAGHVKLSACS